MKVTQLIVADKVEQDENGNLTATNIRREFGVTEFPRYPEEVAIAVHLEGDLTDLGTQFELHLRVLGPDGANLAEPLLGGRFPDEWDKDPRPLHQWLVIQIKPFPAEVPGEHLFQALLNRTVVQEQLVTFWRAP